MKKTKSFPSLIRKMNLYIRIVASASILPTGDPMKAG